MANDELMVCLKTKFVGLGGVFEALKQVKTFGLYSSSASNSTNYFNKKWFSGTP